MTETIDYCKGCYTKVINLGGTDCSNDCAYSLLNDSSCPCTECIVKTMCMKSCNDFDIFRDKHPYYLFPKRS